MEPPVYVRGLGPRLRAQDKLLFAAVTEGTREEVERLVRSDGAAVDARMPGTLSTPLHAAAGNGDAAMCGLLLGLGALIDALEDADVGARTPFLVACAHGHHDAALLLANAGADLLAAEEPSGLTCLHLCARAGHNALALALVARGADAHRGDAGGLNPSFHARAVGNLDFLRLPGVPEPAAPALEEIVVERLLIAQERAVLVGKLPALGKKKPKKK